MISAARVEQALFANTLLLLQVPITVEVFEVAVEGRNEFIISSYLDGLNEDGQEWSDDILLGPAGRNDYKILRLLTKHDRFTVPLAAIKRAEAEAKKMKRKMAKKILAKYKQKMIERA
jgi:hypothetical protein